MDRYRIIGSQSADGSPVLTHLEKSTFEFQLFEDESGGQIDLTGYTAEAAVNNTFDHTQNELMAYASGENCVVTDAEHGIIQVTLDCNTVKFGQVVRFRAQNAMLELNLIDHSGEAKRFALMSVKCMPRVRNQEGSPSPGDPRYLNEAEVNALMDEREFAPSGGEVGDVLTKTATGQEWAAPQGSGGAVDSVNGQTGTVVLDAEDVGAIADPETAGTVGQVLKITANGPAWESPEQLVPVTGNAITPESGIYYTQTAASGDIAYTFTFSAGKPVTFEFWITKTASGAWTFSTSNGVSCWWENAGLFAPENPPPEMTETGRVYQFTFRWDGTHLLGNLAYMKQVSA